MVSEAHPREQREAVPGLGDVPLGIVPTPFAGALTLTPRYENPSPFLASLIPVILDDHDQHTEDEG